MGYLRSLQMYTEILANFYVNSVYIYIYMGIKALIGDSQRWETVYR